MRRHRCDAIMVELIVTEYDDHGCPIREMVSAPKKIFRAAAADVWAEVDKAVTALETQRQEQSLMPAPLAPVKGKRKAITKRK